MTSPGPAAPPTELLAKLLQRGTPATTAALAALPRPVVFTNGVFDILHRGHVSYLAAARALGGSLVLGLNSDVSARGLGKGPDRPLNRELDRACVLAALQAVDAVLLFDEPTPVALLAEVQPAVYVKGGDYDIETLAETALVRSWGGQALALPFVDGYSTTALVQRIRSAQAASALAAQTVLPKP
jgi:rfaE bifunctional protein nucleotidyltransferase chain/domain